MSQGTPDDTLDYSPLSLAAQKWHWVRAPEQKKRRVEHTGGPPSSGGWAGGDLLPLASTAAGAEEQKAVTDTSQEALPQPHRQCIAQDMSVSWGQGHRGAIALLVHEYARQLSA